MASRCRGGGVAVRVAVAERQRQPGTDVLHFYDSEQTKLTELTLRFDEVERLGLEQQVTDGRCTPQPPPSIWKPHG